MNKTRIVVAGIGGVGGYFGGLLAKHFDKDDAVSVCFLARGEHLKAIKKDGLKVVKGADQFVAMPALATDDASEIGIADFVIVTTKSYDLEQAVAQLKPCIDSKTVIVPFLNGVDSRERIKSVFPENMVLDGCAYIVSRLTEAGKVENLGNIEKLFFGLDHFENEQLRQLESLFIQAGIEAKLSVNIATVIWEKFIFIAAIATATTYFDCNIGAIVSDPEKVQAFTDLVNEVKQVALAKQIAIVQDITDRTLKILHAMPAEATSSMHSDFLNKKAHNELQSLTGYVVREGEKYGLKTPVFNKMFGALEHKTQQ